MKSRTTLTVNLAYASLLIAAALVPSFGGVEGVDFDGFGHAFAYGLQSALLLWLFLSSEALEKSALASFSVAVLFGVFTECLQLMVPYRHFEWEDVLADAAGAAVVVLTLVLVARVRSVRTGGGYRA